ncbi:amino acid transporter [Rhodococcus triatomae]|uniref:L-lysine exporter family protein LysE/ArgO n=1 Tax=Rhodococcus triatomae TaxID=300028 RepID=A0A1G8QGG6_9NOCA|nr:LysE/ArgO family amino acid transporter [Rhodococcus triatomae]QNG20681.1 amino acid transporter [Rhodococcus triatomae]QNG23401.1 amino acid transporter [Rhodococcus triatomae]SDJ03683.1 L-lysine exporter family protein LysE/ArgO [Rhodococcus triatomae]
MSLPVVATGFGTGLSLIVAIGAQNAFVLRQAVSRRHVTPTIVVCAVSDLVLIGAGIAGVATLLDRAPGVLPVIRWAGVAFLLAYAALALWRAVRPVGMTASEAAATSGTAVILTCLALTWLNPHVYLDTVVLLGSIANQHGETGRWWFGVGAAVASVLWFLALGIGGRRLSGVFSSPRAWRYLDLGVAALMVTLAATLVVGS